jgi:hypothetical protein
MIDTLRARQRSLGWVHRAWFFAIFACSLAFLIFIPPFQTNDEPSHWRRLWSTASGHLTCGPIPAIVDDMLVAGGYSAVRDKHEKFNFAHWDAMRQAYGINAMKRSGGNACVYIPVAYLLPALAMVPFVDPYDPRHPAGMLRGFYAARAANWLTMAAAVWMFLLLAPGARNLTLVLYSLPTVMQQTSVVNQEATILSCAFAMLYLWWRRPSLLQVVGMLLVVTILSMMKAIFLVLLLWWACALWRWQRTTGQPRLKTAALAALAMIPLTIQAVWSKLVVSRSGGDYLPGWGVSPGWQMAQLRQNPLLAIKVIARGHLDLFGRGHMNGGWTGVLGVLGWADFEIGDRAYALLFAAIALALVADFLAVRPTDAPAPPGSDRSPWIEYVGPLFSSYLLIPAVIFAMYLVFTRVGEQFAIGVQGRYLLFTYFTMLALGVEWARRRWRSLELGRPWVQRLRAWLPAACALLCVVAARDAFHALLEKWY